MHKICNLLLRKTKNYIGLTNCFQSTAAANVQTKEITDTKNTEKDIKQLAEYRFVYPEFLPDPNYKFRHKIREKLERMDMLKRRSVLHIPEFYVGSILAVTATDPHAPGKKIRFLGICVQRTYAGLRATFTLRNVVDNQGLEIMYDMYNPTILSIDVIKLEKRLDDELFYLRDAYPEYSTFPLDMEPEYRPEGEPVPVNPIKVKLKPPPWHKKWEQKNCKGIENAIAPSLKRLNIAKKIQQPWEAYDIMKEYRRCIPEEDQAEIWKDFEAYKDKLCVKEHVWKRSLQKAPRK